MELQLQVTEEELLEFPEVRLDQVNTSHTDNSAGEVVLSTEKSRSCGSCSADTLSKIKVKKLHYRRPVAHRRRLVRQQTFDHRKQKDRRLVTGNVHTPSIFYIQVRPNLTAFAKTLTPKHLGICI